MLGACKSHLKEITTLQILLRIVSYHTEVLPSVVRTDFSKEVQNFDLGGKSYFVNFNSIFKTALSKHNMFFRSKSGYLFEMFGLMASELISNMSIS